MRLKKNEIKQNDIIFSANSIENHDTQLLRENYLMGSSDMDIKSYSSSSPHDLATWFS